MASPDSTQQNLLGEFLVRLMKGYSEIHDLGEVFSSRFAFTLTPYQAPEPDVAFVSKDRLHLVHETGMRGGPDIAVEIVSKDSKNRDYEDKKRIYQSAGVLEYWIIDPIKKKATFYQLEEGKYTPVFLESGHLFHSKVLTGFSIDVEWFWMNPLPNIEDKILTYMGKERVLKNLIKEMKKEEIQRILAEEGF